MEATNKSDLQAYISQYGGMSRYTRLLKLSESPGATPQTQVEALILCINLAKQENMLG